MPESGKNQTAPLDAWLLAFISAVGYLMALVYEKAYCSYFGIPSDWISLSPTVVFATIAGIMAGLVAVFWVANVLGATSAPEFVGNPVWRAVIRAGVLFVFVGACLIHAQLANGMWYGGGAAVMIVFVFFILPLIAGWRVKGGYGEKLRALEEKLKVDEIPGTRAFKLLPFGTKMIVVLAFLGLCGAVLKGDWDARMQEEFLVPSRGTGKVVLRKNGNILVVASFDPATKTLSREFSILEPGSAEVSGSFVRKRVGPLKVRKSATEAGQGKGKGKR